MVTMVEFQNLACNATEDSGSDGDEIDLRFNDNTFWRGQMKGGRLTAINVIVPFPGSTGIVKMLEDDAPFGEESLGSQTIRASEINQGSHHVFFLEQGANYDLEYRVRDIP
ncbi:hypothetical protein ABZ923_41255 [Streptomyces sp. NPDC046881]|uniref:hypothetical protein n=1 Tax=Streptomyces sp. NPDC046881 TaxID=3155374 RepID=UPI003405AF3F